MVFKKIWRHQKDISKLTPILQLDSPPDFLAFLRHCMVSYHSKINASQSCTTSLWTSKSNLKHSLTLIVFATLVTVFKKELDLSQIWSIDWYILGILKAVRNQLRWIEVCYFESLFTYFETFCNQTIYVEVQWCA